MDNSRVCELLLERFGLRVKPEMGQYVLRQLQRLPAGASDAIAVMGGQARTGVAVRQLVTVNELIGALRDARA